MNTTSPLPEDAAIVSARALLSAALRKDIEKIRLGRELAGQFIITIGTQAREAGNSEDELLNASAVYLSQKAAYSFEMSRWLDDSG